MGKVIIIVLVVIFIIGAGIFFFISSGPDLSRFEHLKEPQISVMNNQKMIEVALKGDPNATAGKAIGQLFATFYQLKNNKIKHAPPRARWTVAFDTKKEDWIGVYGLPVSDTVRELPATKKDLQVELTTWEYGTVAEILHIGPYSEETPTIEKLKSFIAANGYEITGDHEEEYLKGPGLWPTDPHKYYTIIRYRVQKKE